MHFERSNKSNFMELNDQEIRKLKSNLFYRSQDSIINYKKFEWHQYHGKIDTYKVNSSQALAIDFWGCLILSPYKDSIINYLFDKQDCTDWMILPEFTQKELLNEPQSTQIDYLIECKSKYAIFIESKFTEKDGGGCSQVNETTCGKKQCNRNYEEQLNPVNNILSKCALSGKKIKYWHYIDLLTSLNSNDEYKPCPFVKGEYQWMRNLCFAEAYALKYNIITETYLTYYKSEKCPISIKVQNQSYLGGLKGKLLNMKALSPLSYNDLLNKIISFIAPIDLNEKKVWMDLQNWMVEKEKQI